MKARVLVSLKTGVLDPQGKAIERALAGLGFSGVGEVRQGKHIEIELAESDATAARAAVEQMCQKLLANTVIETYRIELGDAPKPAAKAASAPAKAAPKAKAKAKPPAPKQPARAKGGKATAAKAKARTPSKAARAKRR
jgi:phosphoribosylformylglycinamidine synthase